MNEDMSTPPAPPDDGRSAPDWGGLIFAAILIIVGAYFLLRDTFDIALPELSWDQLWPVLLILLGVAVVVRGWTGQSRGARRRQR